MTKYLEKSKVCSYCKRKFFVTLINEEKDIMLGSIKAVKYKREIFPPEAIQYCPICGEHIYERV